MSPVCEVFEGELKKEDYLILSYCLFPKLLSALFMNILHVPPQAHACPEEKY